jgi:peptide deformylase
MSILGLLASNDQQLRREADRVGLPGIFLDQLISNLYETMYFHNALGLACPQVGKGLKLAVMDSDGMKLTLINPEIVTVSEEMLNSKESCLSCPNIECTIPRHKEITIRNYDIQGNATEIKLTGQAAITAQHEMDHLNGMLITYNLSSLKKHKYKREVKRVGR